jgi:16S rRNA G966 N2-methylase RsmD
MSHLRVISGTAKGRKLRMVPGEGTRPVTDRVKQALFNIIGPAPSWISMQEPAVWGSRR